MRIGLIFYDKGFSKLDLEYPEKGNPGVGGTEYCFLMLARYLKLSKAKIDIYIYHINENKFPEDTISRRVHDKNEAIKMALEDNIDILIFRNGYNESWYDMVKESQIKSIVWAHNYLSAKEVDIICKNDIIKRVVFVGKQQYDKYIDDDIINKSQFIYNMFNSDIKEYKRNYKFSKSVTYTGSLVEAKGFHILAKSWKKIIEAEPDARLNVIGSGKLYDRNSKLGKYNIAEEKYENNFMQYLTDEKGTILPSVKFLGVLGQEKLEIYKDTMVGVINPSGITETFGLSAVEMEACGIPIVTKKRFGLPDTVIHKSTGLLSNTQERFTSDIIKLLRDRDYNIKLGNQAIEFVSKEFDPCKIIVQWIRMFNDIVNNIEPEYTRPSNYFFNDYKFLRILNRFFRKVFKKSPSMIRFKYRISKINYKTRLVEKL